MEHLIRRRRIQLFSRPLQPSLIFQVVFQFLGAISCEFVSVTVVNDTARVDGSIGLFFWNLPVEDSLSINGHDGGDATATDADPLATTNNIYESFEPSCSRYGWMDDYWLAAARTAMCVGAIFGGVWFAVAAAELLLFKVWKSSTWIVSFSILTVVGTSVSFAVFGSLYCHDDGTTCRLAVGGTYTAVSLSLYVLCTVISACAPKPDPLVVRLRLERQRKVHRTRGRRETPLNHFVPESCSTSSGSSSHSNCPDEELNGVDVVEC
jgi:hypothetical protein